MQGNIYTAVIKKDNDFWIGWIEEVSGVNCQEKTKDKLKESLKEALRDVIQFNVESAIKIAGTDYIEEKIAL